jgi:hypothetical protein
MKGYVYCQFIRYIIQYWAFSSILSCSGFTSRAFVTRDVQGARYLLSPLNDIVSSDIFHTISSTYDTCLVENPLVTKSITAFSLCSTGDFIAQKKDRESSDIDWGRVGRFALKGVGSSMIWNHFYESADDTVNYITSPYRGIGEVSAPLRIAIAMVIDQFVWCPLAFGFYDIPIATLLNGANIKTIPSEIRGKLGGMLKSNFIVWTPANIIIYSAPPIYRVVTSNLVDILWQSFMADVAADCGKNKETESKPNSLRVNIDAEARPIEYGNY